MLNKLYLTPLHGVRCIQHTPDTQPKLPFLINVSEGEINIPSNAMPSWSLIDNGESYETQLHIYDLDENSKILDIQCEGIGRFLFTNTNIMVDWKENGTDSTHYFQTIALSLWLEMHGVPCIHANALEYNGKCIALIGPSGMGKSTLSAYLQKQGFNWLTDDMLALHGLRNSEACKVYPSWPQARMWPDSVDKTLNQESVNMPKVHERFNKVQVELPNNHSHTGIELSAIYMLSRNGANLTSLQRNKTLNTSSPMPTDNTSLSEVGAGMALLSLIQHSMLGNAYSTLQLEQARLTQLSQLLNNIPVKKISYASNFETLPQVHSLIMNDLFK